MSARAHLPGELLRAAVIGAGHLGTFHARKYAAEPGCQLVAVADVDLSRAQALALELRCRAVADFRELIPEIDCASVAVPTLHHGAVAGVLLDAGIDCLVEKPLARDTAEARMLVERARAGGALLQVGHLERFNPALTRLARTLTEPRFIECHRLAPFTPRGSDVDVVRDLMIHDLDLISLLVGREVERIDAVGVAILTPRFDLANARLRFAGGGVANVTASRVSAKRERKLRIFQSDAYLAFDLAAAHVRVARKVGGGTGEPVIEWEEHDLAGGDALAAEIRAFLASVRTRTRPAVPGEDGVRALELCERILAAMEVA